MHIPFLSLEAQHTRIRSEIEEGFRKVVSGGRFVLGEEVRAFEEEYAAYSGVRHCIAVANGSDALFISLKSLGIGEGDEVILPALTCAPTWMAVCRTGATPVPVDADANTFSMNVVNVRQALSKKTKAIVPVNLYGHPADLEALVGIATETKTVLVEDNAQAHGARIRSKRTGSFGHVNATSFYPTKNLGALGDGGAITTNDDSLAEKARQYRNYGSVARFQHAVVGVNSRLDELQASLLRIKLMHLDEWNDQRKKIAGQYFVALNGVGDLRFPKIREGFDPAYHLFVACTAQRARLREYLLSNGVETDVHYPVPPHLQEAFAQSGFSTGNFPVTEKICGSVLSLPLWPGMTEEQVAYVSKTVTRFFDR